MNETSVSGVINGRPLHKQTQWEHRVSAYHGSGDLVRCLGCLVLSHTVADRECRVWKTAQSFVRPPEGAREADVQLLFCL